MKLSNGYVIVGAGIAGLTAAMNIRNHDKNSAIKLINGEPYPPYKRTNLSKFLASGFEPGDFTLAEEEDLQKFYAITLVQDTISRIDYAEKQAIGESQNYAYDYLILATGANYELQNILGFSKQKICFYHNKSETFSLQEQFADLAHIAVLGGGVQGIETCYELLKLGKKVSLIDSHSLPLWRLRSPYISTWLRHDLETRGVGCHWQQRIENISASLLKDFELIICCTGTKPHTALFPADAKPEPNLMIAPEVFACGDNFSYPSESNPERCHLWHEAMDLGQLAGSNVAKLATGLSPAQLPKLQRKPYRTKIEVAGKILFLAPPIERSQANLERHFLPENGYYQFFGDSNGQLEGAALLCEERELLKPLQQAIWDKLDFPSACQTLDIPQESEFDGQFRCA